MNPGLVAMIVLITLGFVLGVAALIYVKRRDEGQGDNDKDGSTSADAQTSGESSNAGADGFASEDTNGGSRDLILEADGSGTLGNESPEKIADALEIEEGESDGESTTDLEML